MQHLWQLLQNKVKTSWSWYRCGKTKWIYKSKQLSNTCEMFEASLGVPSLPIDSSQTFRRNSSEFMGKLIKDRTTSRPKSRPQILDVDSLAIYRRTISDRTFTNWLICTNANNCQVLVKCSWLKVSEDSLGRDKTLHQTNHEHFSSVNQNERRGKMVVAFGETAFSIPGFSLFLIETTWLHLALVYK